MAIKFDEAFEVGPDGAAITTSNSQLTSTVVPAGASINFSSTQARGSLSAAVTTPSTYAATYMGKSGLNVSGQDVWFRWYGFYADFITPSQSPGFLRTTNALAVSCFSMRPSTAGIIQIQNSAGTTLTAANGTVPVAVNQWIRIEIRLTPGSTTGQVEWWLYNDPNSSVEDDHGITSAAESLTAIMDAARIGQYPTTGHAGVTHYIDDFRISTDGKIGPGSVFVPTFYTEYMPYSELGPGCGGPNPFVAEDYPPTALVLGNVTFNMGTVQAVLNLNGLVPALQARVSALVASLSLSAQTGSLRAISAPGSAVMNLQGITYNKLQDVVKPPITSMSFTASVPSLKGRVGMTALAPLTFTANNPIVGSGPVVFNMGTVNAVMNLNGIVAKPQARPLALSSSLTLSTPAPVDIFKVTAVPAAMNLRGIVPQPATRKLFPAGTMNLVGLTPSKASVTVTAPSAMLVLRGIGPQDGSGPRGGGISAIRALGKANLSDSKDTISR